MFVYHDICMYIRMYYVSFKTVTVTKVKSHLRCGDPYRYLILETESISSWNYLSLGATVRNHSAHKVQTQGAPGSSV